MSVDQKILLLIETVVNRMLRLDPVTITRTAKLEGKVVRLRFAGDEPLEIYVLPSPSGLTLLEHYEGEPDVTLTGDIPLFARFAWRKLNPAASAAGEVSISGDIELGRRFQDLFEQIDIDWEERAAQTLGDVAAHQLGNMLRDLHAWSSRSRSTLAEDAKEYLQEESRLLPAVSRAEAFRQAVESLRREAEQLERRMEKLGNTPP